jgi:hypothetical protein
MLTSFVSVYVPSTKNCNIPLTRAEVNKYTAKVARHFSAIFGGATVIKATGYYLANDGKLVKETQHIVKSFHAIDAKEAEAIARQEAATLRDELTQESVTIETNEGIDFI